MLFELTLKRKMFFYYFPVIGGVLIDLLIVLCIAHFYEMKDYLGIFYLFLIVLSVVSVFIIIPISLLYFKFLKLSKNVIFEVKERVCFFSDGKKEFTFYKSDVASIFLYKLPSAHNKDISFNFIDNFYFYRIVLENGDVFTITSLICEKMELVLDNKIIKEKRSFYSFVFKEW